MAFKQVIASLKFTNKKIHLEFKYLENNFRESVFDMDLVHQNNKMFTNIKLSDCVESIEEP